MDRARRTLAGAAAGFFAALCQCAWALNPALDISQYAHTSWTIRDGFFDGPIQTIAQTPDGYLWLGTEFGLLRFDGVRKVAWNPPGGERLPSPNILRLLVTRDGRLWIGTRAGLASWKDNRLLRYPELSEQTFVLAEDHEGTVWLGTRDSGNGRLCAIRSGAIQCYGQDGRFGRGVLSLFEEHGNFWVGADTGIWQWKPNPPRLYTNPDPGKEINDLSKSNDGRLLIAMASGVKQLARDSIEPSSIRSGGLPPRAWRLLRDRDGGLWIGTADRGLLHVHQRRTDEFNRSDGLSGNSVYSLFEDREGNIWAATTEGLDRFRDFAIPTMSSKQGLASDLVGAVLAARDGSVWIGGIGGLSRWKDGQITIYRKRDGLPDDTPQSLLEDSRGRIWVSTSRGFAYWEDGRFIALRSVTSTQAEQITEAEDGSLWLVDVPQGLIHLRHDEVAERIPWSALGHDSNATYLTSDAKRGGIWVGFLRGGVVFFKDGQIRESYGTADGLGAGLVAGVYPQPDSSVWAATEGGLSRIKDGHVATLNSQNGLPCDSVRSAIEDDEHAVWLYLACGLVRISRDEFKAWVADPHRSVSSTIFEVSDGATKLGLGGYSPRAAKLKDGQLWFVTVRGVMIVDPRHLAENKIPPPVHIEEIVGDDQTLWQNVTSVSSANPRLPALTHRLKIRYTALSFAAPEKIRFKYKLEGYDRGWMEAVNKRDVEYTNLPPRNYRFRVMAANNSGVWNETGDSLDFSIAPAYYQTNWFRALLAATVLAVMGAAYQFRIWRVQRESRRLRDVIETIPAYVWSALPDGFVDFINRRWLEFSGFTLNQAMGWGWADALHPDDRDRLVEAWRAAVASGKALEAEGRMRGADGQYRWLLFRSVPQRDGSGKIVKWYGKSMDITELKRAEEERERMHELEADLAHMNRVSMMGELSASIAHEVNQPLAGIVSNGSAGLRFLTADAPDVEEAREAFRDIVRDGKRAGEIIRRIRALTKRTETPREKLDLNETIREVLALVGDEAKKNSVTVRTQFADEVSPVHGDRVQLQQVLLNLIMNAIQAMSGVTESPRQLAITTRTVDQNRLEVTVEDSGVGLDPEKIARIFEPFYTTKSGGMGMGLSICRSIVQSHGGRLWATANEGPGASFHFTLPRDQEQKAGAAAD